MGTQLSVKIKTASLTCMCSQFVAVTNMYPIWGHPTCAASKYQAHNQTEPGMASVHQGHVWLCNSSAKWKVPLPRGIWGGCWSVWKPGCTQWWCCWVTWPCCWAVCGVSCSVSCCTVPTTARCLSKAPLRYSLPQSDCRTLMAAQSCWANVSTIFAIMTVWASWLVFGISSKCHADIRVHIHKRGP